MDRNEIKDRLQAFICRELIRNPDYTIADGEPLITGGLIDSFSLAEIAVFIESAFGVFIPDTDLTVDNLDTLGQMVDRIMQGIDG